MLTRQLISVGLKSRMEHSKPESIRKNGTRLNESFPPTPLFFFFFPYRRSQKGFYPLVYCVHMYTHISSRSAGLISLCEDMKRPQTDEPGEIDPYGKTELHF
jgi:hypothetical protein